MIMVIDTAKEQAFIGLWQDKIWLAQNEFIGGRDLNAKILLELEKAFSHSQEYENSSAPDYAQIKSVIVNAGPGSFTGLRIGLSVANTIAYTNDIPIVGVREPLDTEDLLQKGLAMLKSRGATFGGAILPHYGAEPHITQPKKG